MNFSKIDHNTDFSLIHFFPDMDRNLNLLGLSVYGKNGLGKTPFLVYFVQCNMFYEKTVEQVGTMYFMDMEHLCWPCIKIAVVSHF